MAAEQRFFARHAWVEGRWAADVLLVAGDDGCWSEVRAGAQPHDAQRLSGAVLPGLVDAHSHAFQRAIAGLTERAVAGQDDFWSWRDRMYQAALRITPRQLEDIAAFLYSELRAAGYTQVCEFHYLHNDADGRAYADPLAMSLALVRAAQRAGIGLTLLPTLYMRSGFGATGLREDQRRFASTPESVLRIAQRVRDAVGGDPRIAAGVALHSIRAVDAGALKETVQAWTGGPVHVHISEQVKEVEDCLAHTGRTPIDWLMRQVPLDARWNLVHATHATKEELAALAPTGAAIVLCPSTEANLGDGVFELPAWLAARGAWSIGSDSHVGRDWAEELRLLEYSQRFARRQRNVAGTAAGGGSTAAALFEGARAGGSAAAGLPLGGIAVGQRADFMVMDLAAPALAGLPVESVLDALVFSGPGRLPKEVYVAAEPAPHADLAQPFQAAMRELWG